MKRPCPQGTNMYAEPLIVLIAFFSSLGFVHGHRSVAARLRHAFAMVDRFVDTSGHGILPDQLRQADCVAAIPGFQRAQAGEYTAIGHGFITCRDGDSWSAP